jgi:hypothetical protein
MVHPFATGCIIRAAEFSPRDFPPTFPKESTMAEAIRDDRYIKPVDPIDPTNCPTCLSGFQPTDPPFEEAIDPGKTIAY